MIDVHCHILPGLDDGSRGLEESLEMAESAIADGITRVVATPHASSSYVFDFARVRECRNELQKHLGDRLLLATGCDFHMSPENMIALREEAPRTTELVVPELWLQCYTLGVEPRITVVDVVLNASGPASRGQVGIQRIVAKELINIAMIAVRP